MRRHTHRLILLIFAGLLVTVSVASAQDGLALMKVEAGARPAGMAGAFVSISGDANSTAYNPAGAVNSDKFTASLGHNTYWDNVRLETGYLAIPLSSRTWFHSGLRVASIDNLERRTIPSTEPEYLFDARDISFKSGLAVGVTPKLSAGASVGWFFETIDAWRGSSFNIDFGALYEASEQLHFGGSVTNLGGDFTLDLNGNPVTREISLPTTYRVGGSYRYDKYLGALDLVIVDDEAHAHLGAEALVHELLSLRAGYMAGYDSKNVTAGASFIYRNLSLDYAFVPYSNDLGTSHLINLTATL